MIQRKQFVINSLVAAGANVVADAENGILYFVDNGVFKGKVNLTGYKAAAYASQAEKVQVKFIDFTAKDLVISTRYTLFREPGMNSVVVNQNFKTQRWNYTTPDVIAVQATEKLNLIDAIVAKVNADNTARATASRVKALDVELIAGGVTALGTAYAGMWVFQGASLAAATWKAQIVKLTGGYSAAAGQTVYVANESGAFSATNSDTIKLDDGSATVLTNVAGGGQTEADYTALAIVEDSGYLLLQTYQGPANWFMTSPAGYEVSNETSQAGVIPRGIGSVMKALKTNYTIDKLEIRSGLYEYDFDVDPDIAKTYTTLIITGQFNMHDHNHTIPNLDDELIVYVDESNSANLTALKSALSI